MFTINKHQFQNIDSVVFEETRGLVIQKLAMMRAITKEAAATLFDLHRKAIKTFEIMSEAGMLRFIFLVHKFNVSEETLNSPAIKAIFMYPDREEELKIDKFHEYLINLHDSEL